MAKDNKKNNKKANKKTVDKKTVDISVKDMFVEEAQNMTFTEEDVKELEETRQQNAESKADVIEEQQDEENTETVDVEETPIMEELLETNSDESGTEDTVTEFNIDNDELPVVEENTILDETKVEEQSVKVKPKRRITTKEAYGYHWMGLIYDE